MDRPLSSSDKRFRFFKEFDYLDLFPYTLAALMMAGNIYIFHQFVVITQWMHLH